jgi:hypothetical protein
VFRGIGIAELVTSSFPTGNEISFDTVSGNFSVGSDNPFFDGELITVQYY